MGNKTPGLASSAIIDTLGCAAPLFKTSTFDNGKKFSECAGIDKEFESMRYFAGSVAS